MKKRLFTLLLALAMVLSAAGCGGSAQNTPAAAPASVPAKTETTPEPVAEPEPVAAQQGGYTALFRDGFDSDAEDYGYYWDGGSAEVYWENGELAAYVTCWGEAPHAVQVYRRNFRLKGGAAYRLAFDARSTESRVIELCVQEQGGDWDVLCQKQAEIGPDVCHIEVDFSPESSVPAQIAFNLGCNEYTPDIYQAHTVYLDNVELLVLDGDDRPEGQTGAVAVTAPQPVASEEPPEAPEPAATPEPAVPASSGSQADAGGVYTSTTNPDLKATVDTATVVVNGTAYTDLPLKMDLDYAEQAGYVKITGIPGDRSIVLNLMLYSYEWKEGLTLTEFTDSTLSFISLYGFYDRELDSSGSNMIWSSTGATTGDYEYWQIFKESKCVIEKLDSHGITQYYLHVKTKGPTSGKEYDIEALVVRDFTGETAPEFIEGVNDLCVGCHGSGKCSFCSGTGKTRYYDSVTHRMEDKQCYTCKGSGVCSICKGTGKI